MAKIDEFEAWFRERGATVHRELSDGNGRFGFVTQVDGTKLVCGVRSSQPYQGETSVMRRLPGEAQVEDALVCLSLPPGKYILDPVTLLSKGEPDDVNKRGRAERGENWVRFPLDIGCTFRDWYEGDDEPDRETTLSSF